MAKPVPGTFFPLLALALLIPPAAAQGFVNFESPQTRPIAISQDGTRLYAVNTPDNRLAVYSLAQPAAPVLLKEIPVGLEPVSVTPRTRDEVWVVNHVSDSVSVVDVLQGVVVDTILVRDEPGDVVFAGNRAFISVATDRQVRVFDVKTHKLVGTVNVFGDDPRALLASADGKTVWVAVTRSGNKTTIVPHTIAPKPPKPTNTSLPDAPKQGIIVSSDDTTWKSKLKVTLPDHDVVEIDAATLTVRKSYSGVGTILFNLAQRPGTKELWVANTEARNMVRFEPKVRGHVIDSRLTRIVTGTASTVTAIDLNPGVDYTKLPNDNALSTALSQPTDVVFDPTGQIGYVAAFGTDRIGVIDAQGKVTTRIEVGNTAGTKTAPRTKRGPRGLAHHPTKSLLYVSNRIANSIAVVDTTQGKVVLEMPMFDPTPKVVREGRGFLYDAKLSGNGTMSCAACHVDGRRDNLAWDLGDPGGSMQTVVNKSTTFKMHPMKGPMVTQTLQALKGLAPFHWRGDRKDLQAFNPAFQSLMGKQPLAKADIDDLAKFLDSIVFGANPNRNLDDTLPAEPVGTSAKDGLDKFKRNRNRSRAKFIPLGGLPCMACHPLAGGSNLEIFLGMTGQPMKSAQLRDVYKQTGRKLQSSGRTSGFGLGNDGAKNDVPDVLDDAIFSSTPAKDKAAIESFVLAFDTGTAPAVGFSRTATAANFQAADVTKDLNLLVAQADKGKCDLVAKGVLNGEQSGFLYNKTSKKFDRDLSGMAAMTLLDIGNALRQKGGVLTFLGTPPGTGRRIGVDRDADGVLDGDEGLRHYGTASPACKTVVRIGANSSPALANSRFALVVEGAPARSLGWLLIGPKRASGKVVDLNLLVDLNGGILLGIRADGAGGLTYGLPVPNDSRLLGAKADFQAAMSASCGLLGVAASRGLEVTVVR